MSMKIKVFFDQDEELSEVVKLLTPAMKSCRVYEAEGSKKAIIFLKEEYLANNSKMNSLTDICSVAGINLKKMLQDD